MVNWINKFKHWIVHKEVYKKEQHIFHTIDSCWHDEFDRLDKKNIPKAKIGCEIPYCPECSLKRTYDVYYKKVYFNLFEHILTWPLDVGIERGPLTKHLTYKGRSYCDGCLHAIGGPIIPIKNKGRIKK